MLLALAAAPAGAQRAAAPAAEEAAFIVRLGTDTVAVERFTRTATRLDGERLLRFPRTALVRYSATLGTDGAITRFESASVPLETDSTPASTAVVFGMDSVRVTLAGGDGTRAYAMNPGTREVSIFLPLSFALYEQLVRRIIGRGSDGADAELIFPGVFNPLPASVRRTAPDSAVIDFFGAPLLVHTDRAGRILGADGARTTQKVTVTRERRVDVMALARTFAARERTEGAIGQLSRRDTVRAAIGGADILIEYGRPRVRGRTIMGGIVPWGEVWRTGANAATGFTTGADLLLGGAAIPAGSYTLYSLPRPDGAELIVNRQTGQWGTEYDPSLDLVRVPLTRRTLPAPVEEFTIAIDSADGGARLRFAWERTEWTVTLSPR
jgi:hypothetical protein